MGPTRQTRSGREVWAAIIGAVLLAMATGGCTVVCGCNAVFGLDDVSFATGGAGGTGGDGGSGGACDPENLANEGEFDPGYENVWSYDVATATTQNEGDQPVLHVLVPANAQSGGTVTNELDGDDICLAACLSSKFSLYASSDFFLNVFVEDDNTSGGTLRVSLMSEGRDQSGTFDVVVTEPCRLPTSFTSPDRLSFGPSAGADFLLDDVELIVDNCSGGAPACSEF